ncbi:MAG: LptF/LptG family permease [Ahrensia sp.]|nr:LptF/LptG family permease [Ahrensia sp.]
MVWISQALTQIDFATNSGGSIASLVHFMGLLIPQFFTSVLPFSLAIGIVQILNTMNMDSEAPVLASAGVSRWRIARPIMIFCGLASVYVFISSHFIEPYTNAQSHDAAVQARSDLLKTLIREGRFTELDKKLTIFVEKKTPDGLEGIMISDARDPDLDVVQFAQTGSIVEIDGASILLLNNGQIQRKTRGNKDITFIRFQSYALSLSQFKQADGKSTYNVNQRPTSYLLNPDPNDAILKWVPGEASAEFHRRMTDWLYILLAGVLTLVLAAKPQSHRSGHFSAFVFAFWFMLLYRGGAGAAYNLNKVVPDQLWVFYAIPLLGISFCLWMYGSGHTVRMPIFLISAYDKTAARIRRMRLSFAQRKAA